MDGKLTPITKYVVLFFHKSEIVLQNIESNSNDYSKITR